MPLNKNILTIQLQDYFHHRLYKRVIGESQWSRFESRLDKNVDELLKLLDSYGVKATFFTLGWIADKNPELIRKIVKRGHEIASAGYYGKCPGEVTPEQFREDIDRAKESLERAGSNRIVGYRSIACSIREKDLWVLDILAQQGYQYDSSLMPGPSITPSGKIKRFVHEYKFGKTRIMELPLSVWPVLGFSFPIGGGNYFRQFPHRLMFRLFKRWIAKHKSPFMLYLHPWELDSLLPDITAFDTISRIRQYRNLGKIKQILPEYLKEGNFTSISGYLGIKPGKPAVLRKSTRPSIKPAKKQNSSGLIAATVVIPCFNETASIPFLQKSLEELEAEAGGIYRFNFIFVDDRSTDDTYSVLQKTFSNKTRHRVIQHSRNMGVAGAIRTGLIEAKTEIVCSIDADCSYDPLALIRMIPYLEEGVDLVTASPYHPEGSVFAVPAWRLFLSRSLSGIYHFLLKHKFYTYTSCFRVYRKSRVIDYLNSYDDFRGIVELIAKLDINGLTLREFPTTLQSRIFGYSKMKTFKTIIRHINLLRIISKYKKNVLRTRAESLLRSANTM